MDPQKYDESVESVELLLRSLEGVLEGIRNRSVNQQDIDNIREGLAKIKSNARSCL